ncbi:MAG: NUDIX domain-containing protein [Desulfovibrionaceae bacterium]
MFSTYSQLPHAEGLIEVIDSHDKPFLLMPKAEVLAQNLSHRVVMVALRNREGRILVTHRGATIDTEPVRIWGLSASTRVRAGESRIDAALRALSFDAGINTAQLIYGAGKAPHILGTTSFDLLHITLFIAESATAPGTVEPEQNAEVMFLDKDELEGMAQHFPDMLSTGLLWAITSGALFSRTKAHAKTE